MTKNLTDFKDKNVIVTGCAGFIGSHLTEELVNKGAHVIGIDNLYNGSMQNLQNVKNQKNFQFHQADIRYKKFINEITKNVDIIFHEAAFIDVQLSKEMTELCNDVNVNGTLNILNAARLNDVDRMIFASSAALYGDNPELPKKESMAPEPLTPYGVSKLAAESYTIVFYKLYGLKTTALRYFNVYGPRQKNNDYSGVISIFIEGILKKGKSPTIFGDGTQTRDFIFIKDVVRTNLLAAIHFKSPGEIFNVATGKSIDLSTLAKLILKKTNQENLKIKYSPHRKGDIVHSQADVTKINKVLDFQPEYSLEKGIKECIGWVKINYN